MNTDGTVLSYDEHGPRPVFFVRDVAAHIRLYPCSTIVECLELCSTPGGQWGERGGMGPCAGHDATMTGPRSSLHCLIPAAGAAMPVAAPSPEQATVVGSSRATAFGVHLSAPAGHSLYLHESQVVALPVAEGGGPDSFFSTVEVGWGTGGTVSKNCCEKRCRSMPAGPDALSKGGHDS